MLGIILLVTFGIVLVLAVRYSVVRIIHYFPHISELSAQETVNILTETKGIERLRFYANESRMTYMLFPRNFTCKGSSTQLNLPRYNAMILSGEFEMLKFFLQEKFHCQLLVSFEPKRRIKYPTNSPEPLPFDLNAVPIEPSSHSKIVKTVLKQLIYNLDSFCESGAAFEILPILQIAFDGMSGLRHMDSEQDSISGMLSAFRAEKLQLDKEKRRKKYLSPKWYEFWCNEEEEDLEFVSNARRLADLGHEIIGSRKTEISNGSILGAIIKNGMFKESLDDGVLTVLVENSDRLASTVAWFLIEVSQNDVYLRGLQKDFDELLTTIGPSLTDEEISGKLKELKYFNSCIFETLRLWPPNANGLEVKILKDFEFDGEYLSEGSDIEISFFALFRQLWMDRPEVFMPHRWYDSHHHYDILTNMFNALWKDDDSSAVLQGFCMSELRVVLFRILCNYDIELVSPGNPQCISYLTPVGANFRFRKRNHSYANR